MARETRTRRVSQTKSKVRGDIRMSRRRAPKPMGAHGRRNYAKKRLKEKILREVYEDNKELKKDEETPEKAYDRAMRGV